MFEQSVNFDYCSKESRVRLAPASTCGTHCSLAKTKTCHFKVWPAGTNLPVQKGSSGQAMEIEQTSGRYAYGDAAPNSTQRRDGDYVDFIYCNNRNRRFLLFDCNNRFHCEESYHSFTFDCHLVWCNRCCICADNVWNAPGLCANRLARILVTVAHFD